MKDPYDVLGVARGATPEEIKSAYRKLAIKHHPDKHQGDERASQLFKEINAAYQILSDPQKRALYDRFGASGLGAAAAGGAGPFGGVPIDLSELHVDGIFGDLLEALGIRVGDRGDLQAEVEIGFEEAAFGCDKTVHYERIAGCKGCGGSGAAAGSRMSSCTACGGRGKIRLQQGVFPIAMERACPRCHGSGRVVVTPCDGCKGAGVERSKESVEVTIPPGVETGTTRKIEGKGNAVRGRKTGDLEIVVKVRSHDLFRRSGDNVLCTLPITFAQAVLGDEIEIPTLDGKGILRVPAGTQPGTVLRVRGKGIPRRMVGGRGDQLCEVQVEIPTDLNDKQKELVMQLADELGEAVQPQRRTFMDKLKDLLS